MTTEYIDDCLDLLESPVVDNSIESWQYRKYTPQSQADLDSVGSPIQIDIQSSDVYINPSKSYLLIKGKLVRNDDNTPFAENDEIALVNNAMMYLFSEIRYEINGVIVERISHPGQASSMLCYLSKPDDFSTSSALKMCWSKDTTNNADSKKYAPVTQAQAQNAAGFTPSDSATYNQGFATRKGLLTSVNPRGSFSFSIPFDHIFGFGSYNKVIYGTSHSLVLTRSTSSNLAIHRAANVGDGKINLTHIYWKVPHVKAEPVTSMRLKEIILSKQHIPVAFSARTSESISVTQTENFTWRLNVAGGVEKPRWIIVGFQTDKHSTQEQNPAVFDNLNLKTANALLNDLKYPTNDVVTNFTTNDYVELYDMFDEFKEQYYGFNSLVGGSQVNYPAFKSLFPIIVFDVRRQSEVLKTGAIDISLDFTFSNVAPANTRAYALILSDRLYKFESDGKNLRMITK